MRIALASPTRGRRSAAGWRVAAHQAVPSSVPERSGPYTWVSASSLPAAVGPRFVGANGEPAEDRGETVGCRPSRRFAREVHAVGTTVHPVDFGGVAAVG